MPGTLGVGRSVGAMTIGVAIAVSIAFAGAAVPAPAAAAGVPAARGPQIEAFDVEQVQRLAPGVPLVFTVYGSPGAVVSLAIGDGPNGWRDVPMRESDPGIYEATVTLRERDRIGPDTQVVATLRHGERVVREVLREPLVLGAALPRQQADGRDERAGPGARAIGGATVVADDVVEVERAWPAAPAARDVRRVGTPVPMAAAPPPARAEVAVPSRLRGSDARAVPSTCGDCAVVESVRAVEGDDAPQRAGAFASSVTGAVLGERFGEAHGRRVTRIWNVLSGRRADADGATRWDVVLRSADGGSIVRRYDERPPFAVGETVRLAPGAAPATPLEAAWR